VAELTPYTDDDVAAVVDALPVDPDDGTTVVGFGPDGVPIWSNPVGVARAALDDLAARGRLLPAGGEVREEWGAEHDGCAHWGCWPSEAAARTWVAEHDGWRVLQRRTWVPVDGPAECCDLHGRHCEPPSELCCRLCTEHDHPAHRDGSVCSAPDLSAAGQ
jgi:hypothetical protein